MTCLGMQTAATCVTEQLPIKGTMREIARSGSLAKHITCTADASTLSGGHSK